MLVGDLERLLKGHEQVLPGLDAVILRVRAPHIFRVARARAKCDHGRAQFRATGRDFI